MGYISLKVEVSSLPLPQWGIPAAAEAANQIDTERFRAHHNEADNQLHFAAFSDVEEEDSIEIDDDEDITSVALPSEGVPISRTEAAKLMNYQRQYPYYNNQQYYQSFRQGQGPQQHWGFWKNGLDNMYYFLSSFFSQSV